MPRYWVYILCSERNGVLYVGVTNDLASRIYQHKQRLHESFTKKHGVDKLVYAEEFLDVRVAIHREKCIKKWRRSWKMKLIEQQNPGWKDLYETII